MVVWAEIFHIYLVISLQDDKSLPNTSSSDEESSCISFSLLRPVVSSHMMLWLPMMFTARQPSVIEHHVVHWNADDVTTVLMTFVSLLPG